MKLDVSQTANFKDLEKLKTCFHQASTIGKEVYFSCKATDPLRPCGPTADYCKKRAQTSPKFTPSHLKSSYLFELQIAEDKRLMESGPSIPYRPSVFDGQR
ncbi:unnamed protein product [marine sediment metagenome]|uniref:Uncharacterized protein n=1 Tax=marine sediment metagenome TaxID=412755 RepID=X0WUQ7_9ZZZZ